MSANLDLLLLAIGLNGAAAIVAVWRRSITRLGGLAGFVTGALMLYAAGFAVWGALMLFFVSSSAMGKVGRSAKRAIGSVHAKGRERDAIQVVANSSASALASILYLVTGETAFAVAAVGGFAAANADTWSSELGVLSRIPPRSIVTREEVPAGVSGGVTRAGAIASLAGSLLIALWFAGWVLAGRGTSAPASAGPGVVLVIVVAAGVAGSVLDSYLGATMQALYRREDGSLTERPETAGRPNALVRGKVRITNDIVNFACTWSGAIIAGGLVGLFG